MRDVQTLLRRLRGAEPLVRLGEVREAGVVRTVARVAAGGTSIVSPFTGESAVCVRVLCHRRTDLRTEAGERAALDLVWDETIAAPFLVEDDSGRAWVQPSGADVIATPSDVSHLAGLSAPQAALRYLHERKLKVGLFVEQSVLREGSVVEISGRVALETGDAAGYGRRRRLVSSS